jgi:TolA-binding protein
VIQRFPQTVIVDQAAYHFAMCLFRQEEWDKTIRSLEWLLETYPETGRAAEALYHIGLCYLKSGKIKEAREQFRKTSREFPREAWARLAKDRLKELEPR